MEIVAKKARLSEAGPISFLALSKLTLMETINYSLPQWNETVTGAGVFDRDKPNGKKQLHADPMESNGYGRGAITGIK